MRVWRRRLSDAYIGPKSRKERPNKTKIGRGRPRHTWLGHHFQGQKVNCQLAEAGACCGGLPHSLSWVETSFSAAILLNVDRAGWNLTELCRCKEFSLTQISGWAAPDQPKTTVFVWNTYNAPQLRQYTTDFHNLGCKSNRCR